MTDEAVEVAEPVEAAEPAPADAAPEADTTPELSGPDALEARLAGLEQLVLQLAKSQIHETV